VPIEEEEEEEEGQTVYHAFYKDVFERIQKRGHCRRLGAAPR